MTAANSGLKSTGDVVSLTIQFVPPTRRSSFLTAVSLGTDPLGASANDGGVLGGDDPGSEERAADLAAGMLPKASIGVESSCSVPEDALGAAIPAGGAGWAGSERPAGACEPANITCSRQSNSTFCALTEQSTRLSASGRLEQVASATRTAWKHDSSVGTLSPAACA